MKKTLQLSIAIAVCACTSFYSSSQTWEWVNSYQCPNLGGSYFDEITYDNENGLIAVGILQDSVEFATDTLGADFWNLPSPAYGDMLVAKFDKTTGQELWVKSFGGYGYATIFDVVADKQQNIYCAGFFWDTLNLDNDVLISGGNADAVLIKLSPTGQVLWYRQLEGTSGGFIQNNAIDITDNGTIVMTADYDNAFTVDGTSIQSLNQSQFTNLFIGGFHQNGDLLWHHTYVGASSLHTTTAIDVRGDKIAICGAFEGSLQLGNQVFQTNADLEWDIFTAQFDTLGNVDWARPIDSDWYDFAQDVEIDVNFDVVTVGYFSDTVDFGGLSSPLQQAFPHTTYGAGNASFVVKYNTDGTAQWAKARPGDSFGTFYRVESDENANLFLAGRFDGQDNIAGTLITSTGVGEQYYVCTMNPLGNEQWIASNDIGPYNRGSGIARGLTYVDGDVYTCGLAQYESNFGTLLIDDVYGTGHWKPTVAKVSNNVLNISSNEPIEGFMLSPNPTSSYLEITTPNSNTLDYQIIDLNGKILLEGNGKKINVSSLSSGIYVINCMIENQVETQKFVKQ